jgi:hypothetical protein
MGYLFDIVNLLSLGLVESSKTDVGGSLLILSPRGNSQELLAGEVSKTNYR